MHLKQGTGFFLSINSTGFSKGKTFTIILETCLPGYSYISSNYLVTFSVDNNSTKVSVT